MSYTISIVTDYYSIELKVFMVDTTVTILHNENTHDIFSKVCAIQNTLLEYYLDTPETLNECLLEHNTEELSKRLCRAIDDDYFIQLWDEKEGYKEYDRKNKDERPADLAKIKNLESIVISGSVGGRIVNITTYINGTDTKVDIQYIVSDISTSNILTEVDNALGTLLNDLKRSKNV